LCVSPVIYILIKDNFSIWRSCFNYWERQTDIKTIYDNKWCMYGALLLTYPTYKVSLFTGFTLICANWFLKLPPNLKCIHVKGGNLVTTVPTYPKFIFYNSSKTIVEV
jgi:hypothetical protein